MKPKQTPAPAPPGDKAEHSVKRSYGGRPPKGDADRKEIVKKVYVTEYEDTLLRELYTRHIILHGQQSLSDFIKLRTLSTIEAQLSSQTGAQQQYQLIQGVRKLVDQLSALGTSFNQSKLEINNSEAKKRVDDVDQYSLIHAELAQCTTDLRQVLIELTEYSSQLG